jgi:hypothetical protein
MSVIVTTPINGRTDDLNEFSFPAPRGKLNRLPAASPAPEQRILAVEFRSPDGRSWHAIGGGATVPAAIDWARGSCSDDETRHLVSGMTWMATSVETGPAPRRGSPISGTR